MTPEQNSYIAVLSYCRELRNPDIKGKRLDTIVDKESIKNDPPDGFNRKQWQSLLNQVKSSPEMSELVLDDVTINRADGGAMLTLKNPSTHEAVVAFQGTATPKAWDEDLKSGYMLTDSQREAINYAKSQVKKLGSSYYIYATGHSKGGNEAALVAIECVGIDKAYAFDAPGNAVAYFNNPTHALKAQLNAYKVIYYSNENCFVSGMNPRYEAEEHWLRSGYDEWVAIEGMEGIEELKEILSFSPVAHATLHLYGDNILNGTGCFADNEVPKCAKHVSAIKDLTIFLEKNLPEDDCRYLLDSLGKLVALCMTKDEDLSDWDRITRLPKTLENLDAKTVGIMFALFEEYPESAELFDALTQDNFFATLLEKYKANISLPDAVAGIIGTGAAMTSSSMIPVWQLAAILALGYSNDVSKQKSMTQDKMRANKKKQALQQFINSNHTMLKVHDLSDEKLALLEALVDAYKNIAIYDLYQRWSSDFGEKPFFGWLDLSFLKGSTNSIRSLLDVRIDSLMRDVRRKFQQAWETDAKTAAQLTGANEGIAAATAMLAELKRR